MSDQRQCPVCKKAPPKGQAWRDYDGHVRKCALAFYERDKEQKANDSAEAFIKRFQDLFAGMR